MDACAAPMVLDQCDGDGWVIYNADCVEATRGLPDGSVGLSVYSPPFANLYVYSDSDRDMGNCQDADEFMRHYGFLCSELHRVTAPGRLCAVHCADLPLFKWRDGVSAMRDFPGDIVRAHEAAGWAMHGRITIWKDPVTEMQRTKAHGLLYKTIQKDSAASRPGIADYLMIFRRHVEPGETAAEPVSHSPENFPLSQWQEWASPVWTTIDQSNTLNARLARGEKDERHMCPLQLDVIERVVRLWSNPGDVVLSPFAGIGSEGVVALQHGRRFVGIELKPEYFVHAARNLGGAGAQMSLF